MFNPKRKVKDMNNKKNSSVSVRIMAGILAAIMLVGTVAGVLIYLL
jgi:hypothetical protein